jgi:DNA-binding LacI/PurR family transcriptional regulator
MPCFLQRLAAVPSASPWSHIRIGGYPSGLANACPQDLARQDQEDDEPVLTVSATGFIVSIATEAGVEINDALSPDAIKSENDGDASSPRHRRARSGARGDGQPSIRDVARLANVSPATVSRSFAQPDLVAGETLARVMEVAEELHYRPSRAARSLTTGKTGNIGAVVPDLGNPFFSGVLKGAQARARESGYSVFLADSDENPRLELELIRDLSRQVDGILICSSRLGDAQLEDLVRDRTLVLLNRRIPGASSVLVDNASGMRQAVDHLSALGHKRIGFLCGPERSWTNRERLRGFRATTRSNGIEAVVLGPFAPVFEGGQSAADLVLAQKLTAVIAYNDLMALGVLSRLNDRGVSVPAEVSAVGFDNIPMAGMAAPPLTTVALPLGSAGRAAVELLLEELTRPRAGQQEETLSVQLIVRASTGPYAPRPSNR